MQAPRPAARQEPARERSGEPALAFPWTGRQTQVLRMTQISIHWFRKGLRLHDNPALLAAIRGSAEVYPVFILDPWFPKNMQVSVNRWRFLLDSLRDLNDRLRRMDSRLFVVRGRPVEVFPELFKKWKVTRLTFEVDTEPYARQRDAEVVQLASKYDVQVIQKVSHTLYDTERIILENNGKVPLTYTRLQTILASFGPPRRPAPAADLESLAGCSTPVQEDHDLEYGIPSLEELGQDPKQAGPHLYPGGESEALQRLNMYMEKTSWVCNFKKPETSPNSLAPSTTVLSPYLKFGCLSVRTFWWRLTEIYEGKKHSDPPVSLHGQLLWREFFYTAGAAIPNFDRMEGNPVCVQVDWDENKEHLDAWSKGQTGYPFIDAIMVQLRTEGWIHHLARHAVACFLTRGDLWISWEEGKKVFEELLLDADWSLNAGNWQWLSASAFFHQFFRVYSPIAFGKKTDRNGEYIKKYIPLLRKFPPDYIYEPWKAPKSVQERAGCIIGRDYPKPIVDHEEVRKRNLERMKAAYARRSPEVAAHAQGETAKKGLKQKQLRTSLKAETQPKKAKTK